MSVTPEILARLETLAARALERASSRMYALVQLDGRRVFERLAADTALARVVAVVSVQVVLLEMNFELEAYVTDVTAVGSRDAVHGQVTLERQRRGELFATARTDGSLFDATGAGHVLANDDRHWLAGLRQPRNGVDRHQLVVVVLLHVIQRRHRSVFRLDSRLLTVVRAAAAAASQCSR